MGTRRMKGGLVLAAAILLAVVFLLPLTGTAEAWPPIDDCVVAGGMKSCSPEMFGEPGYSIDGSSCKPRPWPFEELCP